MICFKKIKWRNLLSTGNQWTEIDLNKKSNTVIIGTNGAGKSTMLDAISFALFSKPHRNINKSQLVNSINQKACVVEVEFSIGSSAFKIVRGIRPGIFEIWKNGTMINQSSHAKEYQKILEQNILKLNHKSFHQVIVLGSSSFIPFMQLAAGHRREVIEDLLDINVFSRMNQLLRDKQSVLKDQLKDLSYQIDIAKNKIDTQKKYISDIRTLTQENKKEYESRINESQNSIDELQAENSKLSLGLDESIREAEERLAALHDKRQALMLGGQDRQTNLANVRKRIKFFEENETCSVCDQTITDSHKHDILKSAEQEANQIQSECRKIGTDGTAVEKEISETGSVLRTLRSKVSQLCENNAQISTHQSNIKSYQDYLNKEV